MANKYKNSKVDLTTTNPTTLYTVPSETVTIVKSILVSNDSGNQETITVTLTNSSGSEFSLFKLYPIYLLGTEELLKQPVAIDESEIIKVTAATANRLHVVMSYMEITRD